MKNITEFNQFKDLKNINEEADPRVGGYGGGGDTYFANVKGNFAGADQTLVGSAVIKLFRFVKRKGYQILLYTWFKPNLYREYMSGLLRYIIRNKMDLPKAKTLYDALYIYDVNKNKSEKEEKIKIKFISSDDSESSEKTYSVFKVGSFVKNENDQSVKDGYYKLVDNQSVIKVIDGKISETNASLSEDPLEIEEKSEIETETETETEVEKDIAEYIKKIEEEYIRGNFKTNFVSKLISEINELITFFKNSLEEMDDLLSDISTENDVIIRIKHDKEIYGVNIKALENLKTEINKKTLSAPITVKSDTPTTVKLNVPEKSTVGESMIIMDNDTLNEEVDISPTGIGGTVKNVTRVGQMNVGSSNVTKNKRIGDELNQLSQVDIDLSDPEFVKQFNDDAKKRACTNVVLEGASEICKVQLGAERLYMQSDEKGTLIPDAKLQNNWLKMVQTIKNQFSRFMFVQEVDPILIRNKMGSDELKKLGSSVGGTIGVVNEIKENISISENSKLNKLLVIPGKFGKDGDIGISKFNGNEMVYCITTVKIEDKTYYAYRMLASVLSGMTNDKTSDKFDKYIKTNVDSFSDMFKPKTKIGGWNHIATFIIGKTVHLSVSGDRNNDVNILYVLSNDLDLKTIETEDDYKKCIFYCATEKQDKILDIRLLSEAATVNKDSVIKMGVTNPWNIKTSAITNFGLNENHRIFHLTYLSEIKKTILAQLKKS